MRTNVSTKLLCRSKRSHLLAGVCSGIAEYFNIDPLLIRISFLLLSCFFIVVPLIYLALWFIIPSESDVTCDDTVSDEEVGSCGHMLSVEKPEIVRLSHNDIDHQQEIVCETVVPSEVIMPDLTEILVDNISSKKMPDLDEMLLDLAQNSNDDIVSIRDSFDSDYMDDTSIDIKMDVDSGFRTINSIESDGSASSIADDDLFPQDFLDSFADTNNEITSGTNSSASSIADDDLFPEDFLGSFSDDKLLTSSDGSSDFDGFPAEFVDMLKDSSSKDPMRSDQNALSADISDEFPADFLQSISDES
jgi:phage shock protein PspC (stress-responsive transcriptional regulator)